ncbi:hypothetical protein CFOL_v3_27927, partial [Cephalotus follicularis]
IEVARSDCGIFIYQRKYTLDLLDGIGMLGCGPQNSLIEVNYQFCSWKTKDSAKEVDHHFCDEGADPFDKERYQRLVGILIYLSHTGLIFAYSLSVVSQFMHNPRGLHLEAVYQILRYFKSAPGKGILFSRHGHLKFETYTDADWADSKVNRRSTSEYCSFMGGNLVTWRSKKQTVVSRSSAEAKYRARVQGVCELIWLKRLLKDLGIRHEHSMRLYCDNKAVINIANNPIQHDKTKPIKIDRYFIREKLDQNIICIPFMESKNQLVDILTKTLSSTGFIL